MANLFTYITFKNGVPDDSALELVAAAKQIAPDASPTAVVVGSGIDALCDEIAASYSEVWKVDGEAFAYPNADIKVKSERVVPLLISILSLIKSVLKPFEFAIITASVKLSTGYS